MAMDCLCAVNGKLATNLTRLANVRDTVIKGTLLSVCVDEQSSIHISLKSHTSDLQPNGFWEG